MITTADILGAASVRDAVECLQGARYVDGRRTAGAAAASIKDNEQARGDDPAVIALARRIRLAIEGHPAVRVSVRPVRWSSFLFSRYQPGQHYGAHIDNAVVHDAWGSPLRTDISFTLFLSDPQTYEGGDLRIHCDGEARDFRLPAGSAVFYPTGQVHGVTPVTRGVRLACIGWIQSEVRRADQRALLGDLETVRNGEQSAEARLLLDKSIGNLLRMWSEF